MADASFDEILSRLESALPDPVNEPAPVAEAVRAFRTELRQLDNLGESHDARDLLVRLEALLAAVKGCHPDSLCKSGCSACCDSETAIFDVSPAEWRLISRHMRQVWTDAERASFFARFEAEHAPRMGAYRALTALGFFEPLSDRYFAAKPYRCPFLAEGRCSIYAARPLACRMYGFFAVRAKWYQRPGVYACNAQSEQLRSQRPSRALTLPSVNMVASVARKLLRGRKRILPLWVAAEKRSSGV